MNIPINWDEVDNNIPQFNFNGDIKQAKVVDVYDGDTIKIVFTVSNKLYKFNCRIIGVDTPELRTKNKKEKKYGIHVRNKLRESDIFYNFALSNKNGSEKLYLDSVGGNSSIVYFGKDSFESVETKTLDSINHQKIQSEKKILTF